MITDNNVAKYVKTNNIRLYEASIFQKNIIFEREQDFIELMNEHKVKTVYFELTETRNEDESLEEQDFEEIQEILENEYKFLEPLSDILSADDYITKLDGIIQRQLEKMTTESAYCEKTLEYAFFVGSVCYAYEYIETEGDDNEMTTHWEKVAQIKRQCSHEILEWGKEYARNVYEEHHSLHEALKVDDGFSKCKNKDARVKYYENYIAEHYPYLRGMMTHPNYFRKIPDFYFSFDKAARSVYAEELYRTIDNKG